MFTNLDRASFHKHVAERYPGSGGLLRHEDRVARWRQAFETSCITTPNEVRLAKVDTQAVPSLAERFNVRRSRHRLFFKGGREFARQAGAMRYGNRPMGTGPYNCSGIWDRLPELCLSPLPRSADRLLPFSRTRFTQRASAPRYSPKLKHIQVQEPGFDGDRRRSSEKHRHSHESASTGLAPDRWHSAGSLETIRARARPETERSGPSLLNSTATSGSIFIETHTLCELPAIPLYQRPATVVPHAFAAGGPSAPTTSSGRGGNSDARPLKPFFVMCPHPLATMGQRERHDQKRRGYRNAIERWPVRDEGHARQTCPSP